MPRGADGFDVYNDIRDKLVARGIPKEEVQFIHDADTEAKKAELLLPIFSSQKRVEMSILSGFLHSLQWFGPQKLPRYFQA